MKSIAVCGMGEFIIFILALLAGTACSIISKIMLSMKSEGMTGDIENFTFPLFQTLGMFIGMTLGLFLDFTVKNFKINFPGYEDLTPVKLPLWIYFYLIIPAVFDLIATALFMYGLVFVDVSIYQMIRGGSIVFVAILKHFFLADKLMLFKWIGVSWNIVSILVVGTSAVFSFHHNQNMQESDSNNPILGISLILLGAIIQSLQYAFEEKAMSMNIAAPPLFLIGMEGLWGSILCICILYPIAYAVPGSDHGSYENPFNTLIMLQNSPEIQKTFIFYFISVFLYNALGILVIFKLDSVWRAILDNFRPITVWGLDLFIYYSITTSMGEKWTIWSWIQLLGLLLLVYGTAIYNGPNPGSYLLNGGFFSCYIDCTEDYRKLCPPQNTLPCYNAVLDENSNVHKESLANNSAHSKNNSNINTNNTNTSAVATTNTLYNDHTTAITSPYSSPFMSSPKHNRVKKSDSSVSKYPTPSPPPLLPTHIISYGGTASATAGGTSSRGRLPETENLVRKVYLSPR